ncbi:transposase [Salmonella enterica]
MLITDAGFQSAWLRQIKSLGWDFIGRIRGTVQFCLLHDDERWLKITDVRGKANDRKGKTGLSERALADIYQHRRV